MSAPLPTISISHQWLELCQHGCCWSVASGWAYSSRTHPPTIRREYIIGDDGNGGGSTQQRTSATAAAAADDDDDKLNSVLLFSQTWMPIAFCSLFRCE